MNCKDFRDWLAESRPGAVAGSRFASAHYESCSACRAAADEETLWQRVFELIPGHTAKRSLWPGIVAAIQEQQRLKLSLSDALLFFSRRLAPAFVVFLVVLGGLFLWSEPPMEAEEGAMIAMLETNSSGFVEEPDAILVAWAEARGQ